jgi:branched-chain amino acid transport system permease protein
MSSPAAAPPLSPPPPPARLSTTTPAAAWRRFGLPLLVVAGAFLPLLSSNEYYIHSILSKVCVFAIVIAGLDLVVGYSGEVSVGHAGLFAAGAYTAAILMWKLGLPFLLAAPAAIVMGALFGFLLGVPALRLTGPYLAMATIAFGLIVQTFVNEAVGLTNGSQGIRDVPALRFGPFDFEGNHFYYLVYPLMVLALMAVRHLAVSYWGRAFEALRENTIAAECCGINRYRFKLAAFVLSAALAGLAGALFVHIDKYIGPPTFSLQLSILFLIALIFGGTRSLFGNLVGTFVVIVVPDIFNAIAEYQLMIFGGLLLVTLYVMPDGLAGLVALAFRSRRAAATEPAAPASPAQGVAATPPPPATAAQTAGDVVLETRDLTIAFGGLVAVNRLNLQLRAGRVHALIGPNGSGKSTTVNLLSGLYRPSGGQILLAGNAIERATPHEISRAGLARTFQNVALFANMSVLDNVLVGLQHTFAGGLLPVLLSTGRARREERQARQRASDLLAFVGLADHAAEPASSLPYGRQRLLEIARALAQDPAVLLLDEPAAGLTSTEIAAVDTLIATLRGRGMAILLIEHHMDLVMSVSDEVTVLDFGQPIAHGTPDQVRRDERVIGAYLGTAATPHAGAAPATAAPAATEDPHA